MVGIWEVGTSADSCLCLLCQLILPWLQVSSGLWERGFTGDIEARLPVDLTYGSMSQETLSPNDYVHKLQKLLDYAYGLVWDMLGDVQMRQKTHYNKKVHGKPYVVGDRIWLYSSVVPKNSYITHGRALT